ncbi:MAG: family 1 glycosylhydrolase [Verrucomicrobiota bacterium]
MAPKPYKKPAAPAKPLQTGKFWWGTSTASFQNEDLGVAPGSPNAFKTDWDVYAEEGHIPPRGEDATFSWTHFDKDLAALKKLGVNHYRFGIEWGRVEPKPGVFNDAAIAQYVRMAKSLRAAGIEPIVTLWHFTFPDWLYDTKNKAKSDFLNPGVEKAWNGYVTRMATALAPYVRVYVPQNEPNGDLYISYFGGTWPPGLLATPGSLKKATCVAVAMFRDAAAIVRSKRPDAIIMGIYSIPNWRRNYFQDPTQAVYNMMMHQNWDHLDRVADTVDIVGVNYYYSQDASARRFIVRPHGELASNYTQNGWEIDPEGFHTALTQVYNRYGKPIIVTENGIGTQSEQKKIRYFREHVNQMRRAMNDGVDIRGYFPWTLIDNYEWAEGYAANFGLTHVDKSNMQLVIEPSGEWFQKFIRANPQP